jgi:hypothetical protein
MVASSVDSRVLMTAGLTVGSMVRKTAASSGYLKAAMLDYQRVETMVYSKVGY